MRGNNEQSKLARAAANAGTSGAPVEQSRFTQAASAARVREPYRIPRLNLDVVITLIPHSRSTAIEGATFQAMRDVGLPEVTTTTELTYETERAARTCAEAFLDPETEKPVGSFEEWSTKVDDDVLGECWRKYFAVKSAYDPVGVGLTQEEIDELTVLVKKNTLPTEVQLRLLRLYGTGKLSLFLLHMVEQLSISATPTSIDGESPSV